MTKGLLTHEWDISVEILPVPATALCAADKPDVVLHARSSCTRILTALTADAEAVELFYDPSKLSYDTILEFFFKMHDPTTKDRQGPDTGTQYRSGIFTHGPEQEAKARSIIDAVQKQWWKSGQITTRVVPAGKWWDAEEYHQLYLDKSISLCGAEYMAWH
jgi:methionine-S-sulfoxide reductase